MKTIKETVFSRTMGIILAVSVVLGIVYGLIIQPFYLQFLNGLSLIGFFLLLAGIMKSNWKDGGLIFFSWKPSMGSYREYRERLREERKDAHNYSIYAGIIILLIDTILSLLY